MITIPDVADISKVADWVELYVIYNNNFLSKAKLIQDIGGVRADLDQEDIEPIVDSIFNELDVRIKMYGNSCPYMIHGRSVKPKYKWSDFPELALCLIFSICGVVKTKGESDGTKFFEQVSNIAVKSFFDCNTQILGFPNKENLTSQVQAFIKNSSETKGSKNPRPKDKDKGVDIIGWKSFKDNRSNQLLLFIQCGAGLHFNSKKPIDIKGWNRIIDFAVNPICGITVPSLINNPDHWEDVSNFYQIIFDRPRIIRNVHTSIHIDPTLRKQVRSWCKKKLN